MKDESSDLRPRRYRLPFPLRVWVRKLRHVASPAEKPPSLSEETITDNISSAGCYFSLKEEPEIGSKAELEITLPAQMAGTHAGRVLCQGKVVRVEKGQPKGRTGVACTIDHYRLIADAADFQTVSKDRQRP